MEMGSCHFFVAWRSVTSPGKENPIKALFKGEGVLLEFLSRCLTRLAPINVGSWVGITMDGLTDQISSQTGTWFMIYEPGLCDCISHELPKNHHVFHRGLVPFMGAV